MKVSMHFQGGAELAKVLDQLSTSVSKKVLAQSLIVGGEPMREAMSRNAPRGDPRAPNLAEEIGINQIRSTEQAAVAIGPQKDVYYGLFQELGTVHHPAQPFVRPAFDANGELVIGGIGKELWSELIRRGLVGARIGQGPSESFAGERPRVSTGGPGGSLL